MSSLFHFGRPAQAAPTPTASQQSLGSAVASPSHYASQPMQREHLPLPNVEDLRQRAVEAVRQLDMASCRVLVNAASALLTGEDGERYVPAAPDDAQIVAWLAEPHVGLLIGEWAGYVRCYRLSPAGRLVVRAFLTDYLLQRTAETGSAAAVHQQAGKGYGYGR